MLGEVVDRYTHSTEEEKADSVWNTIRNQLHVVDEIVSRISKYQPMLEYTINTVSGYLGTT